MARARSSSEPAQILEFAIQLARTLADSKCTDVVLLDVRGRRPETDYIIIGSGTSQRQMRSTAQECEDLGKAQDNAPYRNSADQGTTWVVVDFVETVVHLFEPEQRLYYDLELLYADSLKVDWTRGDSVDSRAARAALRAKKAVVNVDAPTTETPNEFIDEFAAD